MSMGLYVAGIWRYPVKTLAGERLRSARIGPFGIPGDRIVWVRGPEGVRTSRRHYRLLGLHGTLSRSAGMGSNTDAGTGAGLDTSPDAYGDGDVLVNGYPWDSPEALALVREAAGDDAWLEPSPQAERFDILPLLVATDGAVAAFGRDVRRLRPNILIGGVDGLDEREWAGRELHIGSTIVRLDSLRARCPMTTVDPDTLERDPNVLRDIGRRFGGRLALNADVIHAGTISEGDPVQLVPPLG